MILGAGANAQVPQETKPKPAPVAAAKPPVTPAATPTLTKQDVDSWLDGYMPYAISSADIAGAAVVVVKDGQVLTEKGYGYADVKTHQPVDPKATLFRPGSVSKLFTWTAVMQQVEAGKIDLDADVNKYLDFKIPPRADGPVTMRDLMTHTPGFAEQLKHIFTDKIDRLQPLGKYLATNTPPRIFPAGEVPAYSNYGAALAGYIVQRVSGEPFDQYIAHHIYAPLDMQHSSFSQPLQPNLMAGMSKGYDRASGKAAAYELVAPSPAGSMATTADDMSRFMIAHLQNGAFGSGRILSEATAKQMHAPQAKHVPPLNGMALGFYHEDTNGQEIIGHGGDTKVFHSDLHLLLGQNVGIFVTMNSAGKDGLVENIRLDLLQNFMDRYYPVPEQNLPTIDAATARQHAQQVAGLYRSSRRVDTGFLRLAGLLGQSKIVANADGTITAPLLGAKPAVWHEVAPFLWKDASGKHTLAASLKDGKVVAIGQDSFAAITVDQPVPAAYKSSWNLPLFIGMCLVFLSMVALWPIQAIVRWRHGERFPLSGRTAMLYRAVRVGAVCALAGLAGYFSIASSAGANLAMFDDPLDIWLRVLQLLCILGMVAGLLSVWNAIRVWTEAGRSWWAKLSVTLIMAAFLAFIWFVISLQLVVASLNY
jgi:CubicO group peptidase (beta-lactamase class C family)